MNTPALPLSGLPFPHLRTRVAAESFGVRCILRGIPLGTLGSGDLGTPGKHPVMGSGCFRLTGVLHGLRGQGPPSLTGSL